MADLETDQVMYSSKPVPASTKAVAFCCPIVEANLILNPIPDPDADTDSIATSAHGEYSRGAGLVDDQNEERTPTQKLFQVGYEETLNSEIENDFSNLPKIVMDKVPTNDMSLSRTNSQPSVAVTNLYQAGPPGAVVMTEPEDDVLRARSSSIPARKYNESDGRERRKSQELELAQSANPIPTVQTSPASLTPYMNSLPAHRSSSETVLNRQGQPASLTGSLQSLDDSASGDLDIMSIDSDSSEGFVAAAMRMDRASIASSSQGGLEIESESGLGKFRYSVSSILFCLSQLCC